MRLRAAGTAGRLIFLVFAAAAARGWPASASDPTPPGHPRLFVSAGELEALRSLRTSGRHAEIWENLVRSAAWCAAQTPRTEWIPTAGEDPKYENLYDRFYAAMHDLAIVEHLAFASALSEPENDPYFEPARAWLVAAAGVWGHEAEHPPDASKAYAVLRILKGLAVGYDLLWPRLSERERAVVRRTLVEVGGDYYAFFQDPAVAGAGYNKHHGSVDAPPLGLVALALLGEVPQAQKWLDLVVAKHVDYLLPHALTPSGTNEQSSNFWASTMQYRIQFFEALRRVTGRDLAKEFPDALPGRIALAAIAGGQPRGLRFNQPQRSVLFGPSYGQIDYWSPVLVYLARQQKRPIYQYLASWDKSLGGLQRSRYITPTRREELLFAFGPYAYLWYDRSVPAAVEPHLPRAFAFPEPQVGEAYVRESFAPGGIVVGMKKGALVVHAGGRPVLVDALKTADINDPAKPVDELLVADDGKWARIRCVGPAAAGLKEQTVDLWRPRRLSIRRQASRPLQWWYAGRPSVEEKTRFTWPDGTRLVVTRGEIRQVDPKGFVDRKVHYGGMEFADPHPFAYPLATIAPQEGWIEIEVTQAVSDSDPASRAVRP